MTLVDTSVWIDHLRHGNPRLRELLDVGEVFCHVFVVGELACGALRDREGLLGLLNALPATPVARHDEVLTLIAERNLDGRGLGWIDMHLLASAFLGSCRLWTLDRALGTVGAELGIVSS